MPEREATTTDDYAAFLDRKTQMVDAIYPAATLSVDSALSAIGAATAAEE